jgi:hypothetical protein
VPIIYSSLYTPIFIAVLLLVFTLFNLYSILITKETRLSLSVLLMPWLVNIICVNDGVLSILISLISLKIILLLFKAEEIFLDEKYFKYSLINLKSLLILGVVDIIFFSLASIQVNFIGFTYEFIEAFKYITLVLNFFCIGSLLSLSETEFDNKNLSTNKKLVYKYSTNVILPTVIAYRFFEILGSDFVQMNYAGIISSIIIAILIVRLNLINRKSFIFTGVDQLSALNVTTLFLLFIINNYKYPEIYFLLLITYYGCTNIFSNMKVKRPALLGIIMGLPYSPFLLIKLYVYLEILPKISSLMSFTLMIAILFPIVIYPKYRKELCER